MKASTQLSNGEKLAALKSHPRWKLWETARVIKQAFIDEDWYAAQEAWVECSEDEMSLMWVAESKGGFFTQAEKRFLDQSARPGYVSQG